MPSAQLLVDIFATDILPIFVVVGVGFLLGRYAGVSPKVLSNVTFNALAPCLVFTLLVTSSISLADFGRVALFTIAVHVAKGVVARLAAIPLRLDRPALAAFLLVTMFSNSGNFGLPVVLFAFGREALAFATVYFVTASVLSYTLGVFVAASGRRSVGQALAGILRVPTVHAVAAALIVLGLGLQLPLAVMRPVGMLSDAALPVMILVLGMQLHGITRTRHRAAVAAAVGLTLVAAPVIAFALAAAFGFTGPVFQATVLQASMPAAVLTTILALQFDLDADFPAAVVFASTILSPLTITPLIAYLRL